MSAAPDDQPKGQEQTRYKLLADGNECHPLLSLPEIDSGGHLLVYLSELGYSLSSGFGPVALPFSEIYSWMKATSLVLTPWEVLAIRQLSAEYVRQLGKSTSQKCPPPYMQSLKDKK